MNGANITHDQDDYDLVFKDIIVNSDKRNYYKYPNPNNYTLTLQDTINRIYKAELIDVYIPSATDITVNIPVDKNRLYFRYKKICNTETSIFGYVSIQPGTYMNPDSIAKELTRQFKIVLKYSCVETEIKVEFSRNLNRYIFRDIHYTTPGTLILYPVNGYNFSNTNIVIYSMASVLMLPLFDELISGPRFIKEGPSGILYPGDAEPGDYGAQSKKPPGYIPLNHDCLFSNTILSDYVLTDCKIFLSIDKLNGDTFNIVQDESGRDENLPRIFCQIPNNTAVSSSSVKTLLNQPSVFSAIQFYNPPISKLNILNIKWYLESGQLIKILDHSFTIRIYYFQKRTKFTKFTY